MKNPFDMLGGPGAPKLGADLTHGSTAGDLFRKLMNSTSHPKSQISLNGLWLALLEMQAAGVPDYSLARVATFSERHKGPKAQSIRNAVKFRELIDAFAAERGMATRQGGLRRKSNVDQAIDEIRDLGARTAIKMMIERARRLERENHELRSAFKQLSVDTTSEMPAPREAPALEGMTHRPSPALDPIMVEAITKFMSDAWMDGRFWSRGSDGSIVDDLADSRLIAPPGFLDALDYLLAR